MSELTPHIVSKLEAALEAVGGKPLPPEFKFGFIPRETYKLLQTKCDLALSVGHRASNASTRLRSNYFMEYHGTEEEISSVRNELEALLQNALPLIQSRANLVASIEGRTTAGPTDGNDAELSGPAAAVTCSAELLGPTAADANPAALEALPTGRHANMSTGLSENHNITKERYQRFDQCADAIQACIGQLTSIPVFADLVDTQLTEAVHSKGKIIPKALHSRILRSTDRISLVVERHLDPSKIPRRIKRTGPTATLLGTRAEAEAEVQLLKNQLDEADSETRPVKGRLASPEDVRAAVGARRAEEAAAARSKAMEMIRKRIEGIRRRRNALLSELEAEGQAEDAEVATIKRRKKEASGMSELRRSVRLAARPSPRPSVAAGSSTRG